jgi:hypothetical protein
MREPIQIFCAHPLARVICFEVYMIIVVWFSMCAKERVTLTLDKELLKQIDKQRGAITRAKYIKRALEKYFSAPPVPPEAKPEPAAELKPLEPLQDDIRKLEHGREPEHYEVKAMLDEINRKLDRIGNLESRVSRLEQLQIKSMSEERTYTYSPARAEGGMVEGEVHGASGHGRSYYKFPDEVSTPSKTPGTQPPGEEDFIYELPDEQEYMAEPPTYVDKHPSRSGTDDYEYACPHCRSTVSAHASVCSNCGSYIAEEGEETATSPYGGASGGEREPYDPSPKPKPITEVAAKPPARVRYCNFCGQPLTYVEQYDRWYCYSCQRYQEKHYPLRDFPYYVDVELEGTSTDFNRPPRGGKGRGLLARILGVE